jgi:hypothetical protein
MNIQTRRKPENNETNAARQARLRERRKAQGFKRVSLWLSPEQVDSLERLGGEPWLGRTLKELLTGAVSERQRTAKQAALFVVPDKVPDTEPDSGQPTDKAALWREAEQLRQQGLSWNEIARRWNEQGRRTDKGNAFIGHNVARDYRKWKEGGNGE